MQEESQNPAIEFMKKQEIEKISKHDADKKSSHLSEDDDDEKKEEDIDIGTDDNKAQTMMLIKMALEASARYIIVGVGAVTVIILAYKGGPMLAEFLHKLFAQLLFGNIRR